LQESTPKPQIGHQQSFMAIKNHSEEWLLLAIRTTNSETFFLLRGN